MACPDIINNTIKIIKEIKKSTKHTKIVLRGIIILGKYTFENKLLYTIKIFVDVSYFNTGLNMRRTLKEW